MYYLYKDLRDTFIPYLLVKESSGRVSTSNWQESPLEAVRAGHNNPSSTSFLGKYYLAIICSSKEPITEEKLLATHPELFI